MLKYGEGQQNHAAKWHNYNIDEVVIVIDTKVSYESKNVYLTSCSSRDHTVQQATGIISQHRGNASEQEGFKDTAVPHGIGDMTAQKTDE